MRSARAATRDIKAVVVARFPEVVETLAAEVRNGLLPPGSRLPTHRALADRFGLAPATASRVYQELRRRGLTVGEVGRGTFVRGSTRHNMDDLNETGVTGRLIDLSLNYPILDIQNGLIDATLKQIADEGAWSGLLGYQLPAGRLRDRLAACKWFEARGLHVKPSEVLVTVGAQHGMAIALMAVCRPGDTVAVESLTYPGFKILAGLQHIQILPIKMDAGGLLPQHLEEACRSRKIRALYCMPTVHNPLGTVLSEGRRREIVAICRKHDVYIFEDEAYAFLDNSNMISLQTLAPEICFNIQSMTKAIAPGLRIGYVIAPKRLLERTGLAIRSTTWTASPITAELASRWIDDGTAARLVQEKRSDAIERQNLAATMLPASAIQAHPASYYIWLSLSHGVRADDIVRHLRVRGVVVSPSSAFATSNEHTSSALRLALGSTSIETLRDGLQIMSEIYTQFCR